MLDKTCTIFANITSKDPKYIKISDALERIKNGKKSGAQLALVRNAKNKTEANEHKLKLPSVCFSGKFGKDRKDADLIEHSNMLILDFDDVPEKDELKKSLFELDYVVATWISPSAKGVKALVLLADGNKHREHFAALKDIHPDVDRSGINEARVCYESYDPKILIKESAIPFTKYKIVTQYRQDVPKPSGNDTFEKLVKWMSNKRDAFVEGNRNLFIFKLASACCRFGMSKSECETNMVFSIVGGSGDFSNEETIKTISSAYRSNNGKSGTACFSENILVEKSTTKEVEIDSSIYDLEIRPKDVFFAEDVKKEALDILRNGYPKATPLYMGSMDKNFKWKRGEITCLTGIGNMGKSSLLKQLLLMQVICEDAKIGIFAPEDFPAQEYYHELVEMYMGTYCVPSSFNRPSDEMFEAVYDYLGEHFFFIYPEEVEPTPSYIKERFLELIIKRKIDFCVIDPFNQMQEEGNDSIDKYLKNVLSDFTKFARVNKQNFVIIAHPNGTGFKKNEQGDFVRPDVGNIAGGPMWNNKMDNILVYHRPFAKSDPTNPACEFESLKIRRTKVVGTKGVCHFDRDPHTQRYKVDDIDWMDFHIKRTTEVQKKIEVEEAKYEEISKYPELPEKPINVLDLAVQNRNEITLTDNEECPW
jgi:hypothetical protein